MSNRSARRRLLLLLLPLISSSAFSNDLQLLTPLKFGFYTGYQSTYHLSPYKTWLQDALADIGYRPEIHWLPGRRILSQVKEGELDGDLLRADAMVRQNFPNLIQVPADLGRACYAGYALQHSRINRDSALRIGLSEGLLHVRELAQSHWRNSKLTDIAEVKTGLKLLASQRLDLLLLPAKPIAQLEETYGVKLVQLSPHVIQFDIYMYLNPRHEALATQLAEALVDNKPAGYQLGCPASFYKT